MSNSGVIEYGFYDDEYPESVYWSAFGGLVGFDTVESAQRTASKNVLGQAVIVYRAKGEVEWAVVSRNGSGVSDTETGESV